VHFYGFVCNSSLNREVGRVNAVIEKQDKNLVVNETTTFIGTVTFIFKLSNFSC
jgi:hypothetical protein